MSTLLRWNKNQVEVQNFNNDFLILKSENSQFLNQLGKSIFQKKIDFVEEVIVTEVEICLKLNMHFDPSKIQELQSLNFEKKIQQQTYKLPIWFQEHEDWGAVEAATGLSRTAVIDQLLKTEFTVAMFGFLPGFIYLNGLPKPLQIPRKKVPSKYVHANSLALGGRYLGIYGVDSPGGWHVIGRLPISVLEIPNLPPVSLNLEDKIILESIDAEAFKKITQPASKTGRQNISIKNQKL